MSRSNVGLQAILTMMLLSGASLALAQEGYTDRGVMTSITSAAMNDNKLVDLSVPSVNDPHEVELLFKEGDEITSILDSLNKKGFHIQYKKNQFQPSMTLVSLPTATEIDDVLREILEPWDFRVYRTAYGKVIVTPDKKRKTQSSLQSDAQTP